MMWVYRWMVRSYAVRGSSTSPRRSSNLEGSIEDNMSRLANFARGFGPYSDCISSEKRSLDSGS